MVKVLFYGRLADAIGREAEADVNDRCSIGELRAFLAAQHPAAAIELSRSRSIIGANAVADDHCLGAGDIVEFLPPVSGG